jgi:dienelactone hydrolase
MISTYLLLACLATGMQPAARDIQTETVEYRDGDVVLEGFVAWNAAATEPAAGVLVVHQWLGLTDYEKSRCRQLAELGYVAFALDIYGRDERPEGRQQAGPLAGRYKSDRELFRRRLQLGLEALRSRPEVAGDRIAAIGYCFGGTGVLELARSGADVRGVVSFHGGLDSPVPEDGKNIKARILICHGADDPNVAPEGIDAMIREFNDADVDWQMIYYSGAVHSFTQPMAGDDPSRGSAYNEKADKRSWQLMKDFLAEVLAPDP